MSRASGTERMFVDEAVIQVRGGKGGDGCVSFRREKFVPRGGPNGGDGGHGGSVYLVAADGIDTLLDFAGKHHWRAEDGKPGSGSDCAGRRGESLVVPVPTGTLIYDQDSGQLIKDLAADGQRVRVARGGRGGRGNAYFVSPSNQEPREAETGRKGQERTLRLELKLIADAGFVGLPNAGKSTMLARLTRARPKIAPYPFTTREPHLGIAELPGFRRLVLADLPGLIEGAHRGIGLGHAFLRHVERTRVIVHLVDLAPPEGAPTPLEAYRIIRGELEQYSADLATRPEIVVGNKLDVTEAGAALQELQSALGRAVHATSGVSGSGTRELLEQIWTTVEAARRADAATGADSAAAALDMGAPDARGRVTLLADDMRSVSEEDFADDEPDEAAPQRPPGS